MAILVLENNAFGDHGSCLRSWSFLMLFEILLQKCPTPLQQCYNKIYIVIIMMIRPLHNLQLSVFQMFDEFLGLFQCNNLIIIAVKNQNGNLDAFCSAIHILQTSIFMESIINFHFKRSAMALQIIESLFFPRLGIILVKGRGIAILKFAGRTKKKKCLDALVCGTGKKRSHPAHA